MDIATFIMAFVAVMGTAIGLIIQYKRAPHQERSDEGDASLKFAQAAREAAEEVIAKSQRIKDLEDTLTELKKDLAISDKRAFKFEDWARRLSHQVISLGGVPVPFDLETPMIGGKESQ